MRGWWNSQHGGDSAGVNPFKFLAYVGLSDSDRLRTSADQQTMAPRGASERVGKARTSGWKAGMVYDTTGTAGPLGHCRMWTDLGL